MPAPPTGDSATVGPARAGAAGALGGAAAVGLVWALAARGPVPQPPSAQLDPAAPIQSPAPASAPTDAAQPITTAAEPAGAMVHEEEPETRQAVPANTLALRIRLNQAPPAELELLPGIGPVLAQRIADDRARNGPFTSLLDFQRVPGIGAKTAEKLAPHVRLD